MDSIELIMDGFRHACRSVLGRVLPDAPWRESIGCPLATQFGQISSSPQEVEALLDAYRVFYVAHHDERVKAFPSVHEAVARLRKLGAKTAIVTSKSRMGTERSIRACALAPLFDVIVTADDVRCGKPDPEPVNLALSQLGETAKDAVFIGDSAHDIEAANRAGVYSVAVLWGVASRPHLLPHTPNKILDDPRQLLEL